MKNRLGPPVCRSRPAAIRAGTQGLFIMMINGVGTVIGSTVSGFAVQHYFTDADGADDADGAENWHDIWLSFAIYAATVGVLFAILFRHKPVRLAVPVHSERS